MKNGLLDFLQSASNAVAGNVAGPVDLLGMGLNKIGIPVREPVGGSEWMKRKGLMRDVQQGPARVLGETAGLLGPAMVTQFAPQIAKGLLQGADNLAAPTKLNKQTGAIVWHGSPHKFDKFDSSKIGTGEGAQAYGHGLYLAESPDVAKSYLATGQAVKASDRPTEMVARAIDASGGDEVAARAWLQNRLSTSIPEYRELYSSALKGFDSLKPQGSSLYKVDLPDDAIAKMLDWDKPLSQQAPEVQAWVKDPYNAYRSKLVSSDVGGNEPTGNLIFNRLQELMNEGKRADVFSNQANYGAANASRELKDYGIPGIRYLDGGSRGAGSGTSNFVVFPGNEGLLSILERNGVPLK